MKNKSAEITFSELNAPPLIVAIESNLRHGMQLNTSVFIVPGLQARRQSFSRSKLERLGQQATAEQNRLKRLIDAVCCIDDKQLSEPFKQEKKLAPQRLTAVEATLAQLLALMKRVEAIAAAGPLRFAHSFPPDPTK